MVKMNIIMEVVDLDFVIDVIQEKKRVFSILITHLYHGAIVIQRG